MSEISSITPIHPTLKPVKVQRDDDSLSKRRQPGKQRDSNDQHAAPEQHEQDAQPIQHIDEIV